MDISTMNDQMIYDIPTMALRGVTVFPNVLFHFDVGRKKSIRALEEAMKRGQTIFLVTQKDVAVDDPGREDLYSIGTFCIVRQILKIPGDNVRVLVEGKCRARLDLLGSVDPYLSANITMMPYTPLAKQTKRDIAMLRNLQELFLEYAGLVPRMANETMMQVMGSEDIVVVSDYIAQNTHLKHTDKQKILEESNPRRRMSVLQKMLNDEILILSLEQEVQERVKEQMDKNQRDYYLREQIKIINEELGDGEDSVSEAHAYIAKIDQLQLPEDISEKLKKEAHRLAKMQATSPESGVVRTYLDTCLELPWNNVTKENGDIKKARSILDADHYGMEKVKERILEFFAVKHLTGSVKGQILCLVGPPGVGKTSVARSIARAMGRNYARLSLGGVRDEADIRGHRKTYIGAMPGRIINALIQSKSRNSLILIDEIDKMGSDFKGDPSSALLEVFDTEQNVAFRDHFVEVPFDLSDVLFITTANTLDTIPTPLLDRMEVIELGGYTDEEKVKIVRQHILPKQLKKHGLRGTNMRITEDALRLVISGYTREAGVRTLERQLAKLCRKTAKYMTETGRKSLTFTVDNLKEYLGNVKYKKDDLGVVPECGVVNGLAWTSVGGELLEVEVMAVDGNGKLELTGNLGDVMKESVKAALTYIRSRSEYFPLPESFHTKKDIHVHFPEGAVPKDGPSAGITTATALLSALCDLPVPKTIAMTGEITLRGRVLAIGGLKEKTMAAYRNGVTTVIVPQDNATDIEEIDPVVRENLKFIFVRHMDDVAQAVFGISPKAKTQAEEKDFSALMTQNKNQTSAEIRQ